MSREWQFYWSFVKEYVVYILVSIILLMLVIKVFFPQLEDFGTNRIRLDGANTKLENLQNKMKSLESIDKGTTSQKLEKLNQALPPEKDIGLMLSTLEYVAAKSNVKLGTFSFNVGNFDAASATVNSSIGIPAISISVNLRGGIVDTTEFLSQLNKTLPVMRASNVSFTAGSSTIIISYYFKPLPASKVSTETSLPEMSKNQQQILRQILERQFPSVTGQEEVPTSGGREDPFH